MAHLNLNKKDKKQRLVNVDVTHVSLVDSPANQTPFKFVKREDGTSTKKDKPMHVSLKNLFGSRGPAVTSVIASTEETATKLAKMLMADVTKFTVSKEDDVVSVRNSETSPTNTEQIVHLGDKLGVAYTVEGVAKSLALYDNDSEVFADTLQKEGFVPGLYIGTDALQTTIRNIAMAEDTTSPEIFSKKVNKALEEFSKYIDNLVTALPVTAFKFEKSLVVISPNQLAPSRAPDGFASDVYDALFGDNDPKADADADVKADADADVKADADGDTKPAEADAADPADADASPADASGDVTAAGADGDDGVKADVDASLAVADADPAPSNLVELPDDADTSVVDMEALMAAAVENITNAVGKQIETVAKTVDDLGTRLDNEVKSLTKAVGGSVASTPDEDNKIVDLHKASNSDGSDIPLLDSAYRSRG